MHRILCISEIAELILENLDEPTSTKPSRELRITWRNLALTCTSLVELGLDRLWKHTTLIPVLKTLPSDLWAMESAKGLVEKLKVFSLLRDPTAADFLGRFRYYADKIQVLEHAFTNTKGFQSGDVEVLGADVLQILNENPHWKTYGMTHTKSTPFPNLRKLSIRFQIGWDLEETHRTFLRTFLSPRLLTLEIDIPHSKPHANHYWNTPSIDIRPEWPAFLEAIPALSPNLISLKISTAYWNSSEASNSISSLIRGLPHLERLECPAIMLSTEAVSHLGGLTSFREWAGLSWPWMDNLSSNPSPFASKELFREMRHIGLTRASWAAAADVVAHRPLVSFRFIHDPKKDRGALKTQIFTGAIERNVLLSHSMTVLQITTFDMQDFGRSQEHVHETLRPLFLLKNLRTFHLDYPAALKLTDTWLEEASISWPRMEDIKVNAASTSTPLMTLHGLCPLIEKQRELISINVRCRWESFDVQSSKVATNTRITELIWAENSVTQSTLEETERVLKCLLALFPELRDIKPNHGGSRTYLLRDLVQKAYAERMGEVEGV